MLDAATLQAYRETHYRVQGDPEIVLRVGQPSAELALLYRAEGVSCSAFITACNPASQRLDEAANTSRQRQLEAELAARGLACLPAVGRHPTNQWPAEPSVLVLGLPLEEARLLCCQFGQNALLWADTDAVPQLVLLT
ncbi:DUF3293 domain-containing protein [Kineobactrum salinum]|uniref:DUF3293 domain-containing protein n=1 Tax=Kineobactrum salinum TaxID=2708301 RepID=A0A6C0U4K3_9GAMM|nr:DUF3293 domain-containing protein [Kineobactrum salinum]QIB67031.1 DUF3293 domain-containing protein [Kineobactrum salinum]